MRSYRITISENMSGDAGPDSTDWEESVSIRCESPYRMDLDIAEWVRTEIDSTAIIRVNSCGDCLDPAAGIHAIDCPRHQDYRRGGFERDEDEMAPPCGNCGSRIRYSCNVGCAGRVEP